MHEVNYLGQIHCDGRKCSTSIPERVVIGILHKWPDMPFFCDFRSCFFLQKGCFKFSFFFQFVVNQYLSIQSPLAPCPLFPVAPGHLTVCFNKVANAPPWADQLSTPAAARTSANAPSIKWYYDHKSILLTKH